MAKLTNQEILDRMKAIEVIKRLDTPSRVLAAWRQLVKDMAVDPGDPTPHPEVEIRFR